MELNMTCQIADALIEDVLNGKADAEGENGLREHLRHCEDCADAWHVAWQVRQTLNQCDVPEPGESYFAQATAGIMSRIRAIDPDAVAAEDSPAVASARYGPLQIRGVGLALLMALGFLVPAFRAPVVSPALAADDPHAIKAADVADAPHTLLPAANHRPVRPADRPPLLQRLRNLSALLDPRPVCRIPKRPMPSPPPLPLMT